MLYGFAKWLTYLYVRIAFRMRYEGLEHIPADKGFILAANHRTYHDPVFIAHKVSGAICYMAKIELFRNPAIGWVLRQIHAFPVARGTGDTSAMDTARAVIRSGDVLGIFPEGTRSKDGKPQRARGGAAVLAGETGADVLPCAICFGERLHFRTPVTIRYGRLLTAEELGVDPGSPSTVRKASRKIMDEIVTLLEQGV